MDSDTENSIIIDHHKHNKLQCLKDTPLKINGNKNGIIDDSDAVESDQANKSDKSDDEMKDSDHIAGSDQADKTDENSDAVIGTDSDDHHTANKTESTVEYEVDKSVLNRTSNVQAVVQYSSAENSKEYDHEEVISGSTDDDGPDEDQMVMSRATRMSIMGVIPKDNSHDTDDSDFIQSDDVSYDHLFLIILLIFYSLR